ncbi:hypothetical protein BAUCODRAFT_60787 [Baudoinia panamericana UAMH 10762]|uniref:Fork-head domain-containing protein n=1 Tax=Baudoinia panamericana (strain UAMH 10762) TaxID=717646 RepID=M2NN81_BAUPA|nr:uncharacterized protein BAUCODRAFT_60787 [Baudoinia panamericana UAMH 10762]EMD00686.1 hypothetical protein BAUCODRAFT_60787 [Baudoinia panamericana UAMH 10762]
MPPSGRKGKARAKKAVPMEDTHVSDVETPDAIATPTRSSTRKRAREHEPVPAAPPARAKRQRKPKDATTLGREDTEGTEAPEQSENETEITGPSEQDIIQHLQVANRQVNATEDYANDLLEGQEHVPGYGKIAGRDWSFIIRNLEVNIGRPEAHEKLAVAEPGEAPAPSAKTVIDIDLGPDRQVSRSHAIIAYDSDEAKWFIIVNGRNGLRIDNTPLKRGTKMYLRNGCVIEIANTQMAFITTATAAGDGPIWDASILKQAQKSSEDDEDGEDPNLDGRRQQMHTAPRAQLTENGAYTPAISGQQQQQRMHPHSQRAMPMPGTPMRSQQQIFKSSPAANYARGVMMESTESIDYASENSKDLKPPHSYAQLIGMAILSVQEQAMTLNNIYKWIMANYAFYRFNTGGWQNSIRHNLSLNKAFTKIARRTDEPGKGMKWVIEPTEFDTFVQQGMKGCRRPAPLPATQSTFGSPQSPAQARHLIDGSKQEDDTPPMQAYPSSYPTANEAYTPDRGPKRQKDAHVGLGIHGDTEIDFMTRSTPRNGLTAIANAAGSPPALYINDEGRIGPLDTPFPLRPSQRFAPPSTLKRPSDFIQFSSPAPFWKMEGLVGSTPFKPYDLSPLKTPFSGLKKSEVNETKEVHADDDEETKPANAEQHEGANGRNSPVIHSSSPPPHSAGPALDGSPTMSRPATAVAKTLSQMAASGKEQVAKQPATDLGGSVREEAVSVATQLQSPPAPAPTQQPQAPVAAPTPIHTPAMDMQSQSQSQLNGYSHQPVAQMNGYYMDEGEDEGIDLAKGFQPIGAYHQRNHMALGMGLAPAFGR